MTATDTSKPLRIAVAGLGTVGQGVLRVLNRNAGLIAERAGRPLQVVAACVRDRALPRDCPLDGVQFVDDPLALVQTDAEVVVELMGSVEPAQSLVVASLAAGKPVVTANKALLAERGDVIFAAAEKAHQPLAFEAAVCGGIPAIKVLREGLSANRIDSVAGIVNGTSNFILTQMARTGVAFETALSEAQELGYAEADPTFDIEGVDAAHKLTLIASIVFGVLPAFNAIRTEGLSAIRASDVQFAQELGYRIKPLAIGKRRGAEMELRVHPTLIPAEHLLASVDGALNAISVHGDAVGQTVYIGPGAGAEPTASAVVADLVDIARGSAPVASLGQAVGTLDGCPLVAPGQVETACYLRLRVDDTPGVLRSVTSILADLDISIEAILQKEPREQPHATLAIITSRASIQSHDIALNKLLALPFMQADYTRLRVEHFND